MLDVDAVVCERGRCDERSRPENTQECKAFHKDLLSGS
jgi:hypothetical protein